MRDKLSTDRLNKLHPRARGVFRTFIEEAERTLKVTLRITSGYRTMKEQEALYAKGRNGNKEKRVTDAPPGKSYHNYGLAVDLVEMKNHQPNWDFDMGQLLPLCGKYGIVWGGTFKNIKDKPHFELPLGYTVSQLSTITKDRLGYPLI